MRVICWDKRMWEEVAPGAYSCSIEKNLDDYFVKISQAGVTAQEHFETMVEGYESQLKDKDARIVELERNIQSCLHFHSGYAEASDKKITKLEAKLTIALEALEKIAEPMYGVGLAQIVAQDAIKKIKD